MTTDLKHGDCAKLLKEIPDKSVDLILTDPPYVFHNSGGGQSALGQRTVTLKNNITFMSDGFDYDQIFSEFMRVCKIPNMLIFCSNAQISSIMGWFERQNGVVVTLLEWVKRNPIPTHNGNYLSDVEYCVFVRGKGATFNNDVPYEYKRKAYIDSLVPSQNRYHPAQKPLVLLERYLLVHSTEGQTVLDPFMGSGSTGVACAILNRNFIGMEIDDNYFKVATGRINREHTKVSSRLF